MAVVRFTGFESGHADEVNTISGTGSIVSTGQRTGGYAFRANPTTTATGYIQLNAIHALGVTTNFNLSTARIGFAFKAVTLPASNEERILEVSTNTNGKIAYLTVTSTGLIKLYSNTGPTLVATSTRTVGETYKYLELKVQSATGGAYELKIDGTSEFSGTADFTAIVTGLFSLGKRTDTNGQTVDFYYDDVYVDNADFLSTATSLPEVKILKPNAAGASTGWTNGTGTTFAEVDEVPPESDGTDATYIQASATEDNQYHTFRVQSTAAGGVTGTINAVNGYVWTRTASAAGTSSVGLRIRNVGTNSDTTMQELTTSYQGLNRILATDPATGAAWTSGGVDTVEIGMVAGTIAQTQRFSAAYIFVLSTVSSSTDLSINKSDSITITESVDVARDGARDVNKSDNITVTESIGRMLESSVNKSDSITVTESTNASLTIGISVSDSVTVTESVKSELNSFVNKSDSITITENKSVFIPELFASVSDSITVTESTKTELTSFINKSESITVTENADPELVSLVNVSDSSTITENVSLLNIENVNKSDSITITENSAVSIVSDTPDDLAITVSDSITVTENVQRVLISSITVNDTATVTENVDPELISSVSVSDSGTITEAVNLLITELFITTSDSITITESIGRLLISFINKSESVIITENTSLFSPELKITVSDEIAISESVTVNIVQPGVPQISVSDSVAITEEVTLHILTLFISKSDSISVTENVVLTIPTLFINKSDNITVTESSNVSIESAAGGTSRKLSLLGVG